MYKNMILLFLLLTSINFTCFADEKGSQNSEEEENEYIVLPLAYYNEATSFGFGVYTVFLFKEKISGKRPMLKLEASYTLKNQILFRYKSRSFFEKSELYARLNMKKFESKYFGLGNNSDMEYEPYSYFTLDMNIVYNQLIEHGFFYSLIYDVDMIEVIDNADSLELGQDNFDYSNFKFNHSFGIGIVLDRHSKVFFRNGYLLDLSYLVSSKYLGSNNNFSILTADLKYFISIKQSSINLQFINRYSFDNVPFSKLSTIGGTEFLRGYPDKRFTDRNMMVFQAQYDLRIYKKISASIFYSLGDVFDEFTDLRSDKIKHGYGIGLLYNLKGTAIRCDIATSPENEVQIIATGSRAF